MMSKQWSRAGSFRGKVLGCYHPTPWPPASAPEEPSTCACCSQALAVKALTHKEESKLVLGEILVALLEMPPLLFYTRSDIGKKGKLQGCAPHPCFPPKSILRPGGTL